MKEFIVSQEDLDYYRIMQSLNDLGDDDYDYDLDEERAKSRKWLIEGGEIQPVGDIKIFNKLRPGYYTIGMNQQQGFSIFPEKINTDKIYKLYDDKVKNLIAQINLFWTKEQLFKDEGIIYKRGILLTGPPGTGKTSIINMLCMELINKGGVIFYIKTANDLKFYVNFIQKHFRMIEPKRNIITIIEDIDNIYYQDSSYLLSFLDGEKQIDHNVVVATTNRIQELDDLILRPSRFDLIMTINAPDKEVKRNYLTKKGVPADNIEEWLKKTDEFTFADLKELYIAYKMFDYTLDESIEKLKEQKSFVSNTTFVDPSKKKVAGFGSRSNR